MASTKQRGTLQTYVQNPSSREHSRECRACVLELMHSVVDGTMSSEDFCRAFTTYESLRESEALKEIVADALWLTTTEFEDESDSHTKLCDLAKEMLENDVVGTVKDGCPLLKERLEKEWLEEIGVIPNKEAFHKMEVRVRTKLYFTQQKFNLLREESEGYSKIITELNQGDAFQDEASANHVIKNMKSLIGYFDLDPNRVFDLVLEAYEHNLDNACYDHICDVFKPEFLPQIVGFKYQYYQGTGEVTPASLYNLTAKLIHRKKLSFESVLVHLTPDGDEAEELYKKRWEQRMAAAHKAGRLSLTGDEEDDDKKKKNAKEEETDEENQKFGVIEGLLHIGAIEEAEELMEILEPYHPLHCPSIVKALRSIVAEMIEPLYRLCPQGQLAIHLPAESPPPGRLALKSYSEFPTKLFPLLRMLSHYLHEDMKVYCKVTRLVKDYSRGLKDEAQKDEVLMVIALSLLPCVVCFDANPGAVQEVWEVLKSLPYQSRFRAYGIFRDSAFVDNPPLLERRGEVAIATKKAIKRLTKENSKQKGKELAKFAHSNPMEVVSIMLGQAKAYQNMIGPVVDACKYFTSMAFDILSYTLMQHMVGSFNSSKLKEDGQNVAGWLMNLASLTGTLFQKYTTNIELPALLLYVASQLKAAQVLDMFVLRNLLQKSGVESMEDGSDEQLEALGGGPVLRAETTFAEQMKLTKKTATRMRDSLLREGNLAVPLYILLSQAREHAIYNSDFGSLKLLSELADKCGDTLIQYTEFMHRQCSSDKGFRDSIPSVRDLLVDYNLGPEAAFFLTRPYTFPNGYYNIVDSADADAKDKYDKEVAKRLATKSKKSKDKDKDEEEDAPELVLKYDLTTPPSGALGDALIARNPTLKQDSSRVLPDHVWEVMDERLYATFWNLSSYDIHVPTPAYEREIKRQKQEVKRLSDEIADSRTLTSSEVKKKEKEKKGFNETLQKLEAELTKHKKHHNDVKKRLVSDSKHWVPKYSEDFSYVFLQHCVYPRCVFTAPDASYCIKFLEILHNNSVPNFSTLQFLSHIFDSIHGVLFKCTEAEASRFGRFLLELFTMMETWRLDTNVYKDKVASKPGFCIKFGDTSSKKASHKEYQAVLFKWHQKLARAVVASLDSAEYLEKRNALIVLTKLVKVFPRIKAIYQVVVKKVTLIKEEEKRDDLKLLGRRYFTMLDQEGVNQLTNEIFKGEPEKAVKPVKPKKETKKEEPQDKDMDVDAGASSTSTAASKKREARETSAEEKERLLREDAMKKMSRKEPKEEELPRSKKFAREDREDPGKRDREEGQVEDGASAGSGTKDKKAAKAQKKEKKDRVEKDRGEKHEKKEEEKGAKEEDRGGSSKRKNWDQGDDRDKGRGGRDNRDDYKSKDDYKAKESSGRRGGEESGEKRRRVEKDRR